MTRSLFVFPTLSIAPERSVSTQIFFLFLHKNVCYQYLLGHLLNTLLMSTTCFMENDKTQFLERCYPYYNDNNNRKKAFCSGISFQSIQSQYFVSETQNLPNVSEALLSD